MKREYVVISTPYQTVDLQNVIQTERNRVVMIPGTGSVATQQNTVLVGTVLTTTLTSGGENLEENKCGETTEDVFVQSIFSSCNQSSVRAINLQFVQSIFSSCNQSFSSCNQSFQFVQSIFSVRAINLQFVQSIF